MKSDFKIMLFVFLNSEAYLQKEFFSSVLACESTVLRRSKSKVIPLQAWTGREGSRRLRLPDFKTVGT